MRTLIAPYWDVIFPIEYSPLIRLPQGSTMSLKAGDRVGYNEILTHSRYSPVGEQYMLDGSVSAMKLNVLDGELVVPGDVLVVSRKGIRWVPSIFAKTHGIVSLQGISRLAVLQEETIVDIKSGFIGNIKSVNLRKNLFKTSITGGGIRYIYSEGSCACSGIADVEGKSEIMFVSHKNGRLSAFGNPNVQYHIFDYVTVSELKMIRESLGELSCGFCVLGTNANGSDLEKKIRLVKQAIGKRIFIEDGFLVATCWRAKQRTKAFATIKKGTKVVWKPFNFNKDVMSGKIIEFEEDDVIVLSDDGKKYDEHYLNLWKE